MKIIVRKEKHDTRYYDASTLEQQHAAALAILAERMDPDYAFIVRPDEPHARPEDTLTPEQIAALPTETMRAEADQARKRYASRVKLYEKDLVQWSAAVAAVLNGNGAEADRILRQRVRAGYEYEGYVIEETEEVTAPPKALVAKLKKL